MLEKAKESPTEKAYLYGGIFLLCLALAIGIVILCNRFVIGLGHTPVDEQQPEITTKAAIVRSSLRAVQYHIVNLGPFSGLLSVFVRFFRSSIFWK